MEMVINTLELMAQIRSCTSLELTFVLDDVTMQVAFYPFPGHLDEFLFNHIKIARF